MRLTGAVRILIDDEELPWGMVEDGVLELAPGGRLTCGRVTIEAKPPEFPLDPEADIKVTLGSTFKDSR